ncbi:hypothetical protein [Nonomuraea sediminis]|uniref:hypothetical protein n=1 Tax=Nonomuraea sediminis TaxID=2835864 RepID=UPI001BDBFC38|nr:hypothetical protein [Nonomuraea sediminis]
MLLRSAAVASAAVPVVVTGNLLVQECGWFAYAPPPVSLAAWTVLSWAVTLLPLVLAGLALWVPRRLVALGCGATAVVLVLDVLVPLLFPQTTMCGTPAQIRWDNVAAHALALSLLVATRRQAPPSVPRIAALAWTLAAALCAWHPGEDHLITCLGEGQIPAWYAHLMMNVDPTATWPALVAVAAVAPGGWLVALVLVARAFATSVLLATSGIPATCGAAGLVGWPYLAAAVLAVIGGRSVGWGGIRRRSGGGLPG